MAATRKTKKAAAKKKARPKSKAPQKKAKKAKIKAKAPAKKKAAGVKKKAAKSTKSPPAETQDRGRPRKEIDWGQMEKLLTLQCTLAEITAWFKCSEDTIERACKREHEMTFAEYSAEKRELGKVSLRRVQWQKALAGNVKMLIWLGKNTLGQAEKIEARTQEQSTVLTVDMDQLTDDQLYRLSQGEDLASVLGAGGARGG